MWWFRKAKNQLEIQLEIQLGNQLGNHWDHAPPPPEATCLLTACCMCLWVKLCGLSFNQGFMKATLCKQPLQARIDDQNKDWSDHPLNGKGCMLWWVEKNNIDQLQQPGTLSSRVACFSFSQAVWWHSKDHPDSWQAQTPASPAANAKGFDIWHWSFGSSWCFWHPLPHWPLIYWFSQQSLLL